MYVSKYFPPTFRQLPADQAFVVGIPFMWSGRQYQPGEPFDRAQGTLAQIRRLYTGRKLAPVPVATTEDGVGDVKCGFLEHDDPTRCGNEWCRDENRCARPCVRHVGHGKYCVMRGDTRIGEPTDKESAERELAMLE